MGLFKPIETTKANIGNIKVTAGQMISCSDTGELYFDTIKNGRQSIADLIIVENDEARTSLAKPLSNKLYLVKDTNYIWRYDGKAWNQLTFSKPNIATYGYIATISEYFHYGTIDIDKLNAEITNGNFDVNKDYIEVFINGVLVYSSLEIANKKIRLNLKIEYRKYTSESELIFKIYKNCGPMRITQAPQ